MLYVCVVLRLSLKGVKMCGMGEVEQTTLFTFNGVLCMYVRIFTWLSVCIKGKPGQLKSSRHVSCCFLGSRARYNLCSKNKEPILVWMWAYHGFQCFFVQALYSQAKAALKQNQARHTVYSKLTVKKKVKSLVFMEWNDESIRPASNHSFISCTLYILSVNKLEPQTDKYNMMKAHY